MTPLREIYSGYRQTIAALREVPFLTDIPCLIAVRNLLPAFFWIQLSRSGRQADDYRCYGGYREPNGVFAKVPWVACRDRYLTPDVKDGYFVALLFREDMAGCWLSLNRGYMQFREAQSGDRSLPCPPQAGVCAFARLVAVPERFVIGPIDLGATTDFGRSYEIGAGISCFYAAENTPSEAELGADFLQFMDMYDRLAN